MIDCAVIGAGPAGLAASAALTQRGVEHLVLERGRVGQSWRDQRWDSLRLNNPGWMNPMLGEQAPGTYLTAGQVVEYAVRSFGGSVHGAHVESGAGQTNSPAGQVSRELLLVVGDGLWWPTSW